MPRIKTKPEPAALQSVSNATDLNGPLGEVLSLGEAATYLRLKENAVLRLVEEQALPARQIDKEWRFLKSAIQDWLKEGSVPKSNKEAWLALAGRWKDDPYVEEELEAIYRRRRQNTPKGEN